MSTLKYDALVRRYEAEIAEAKAVLEVYFAASVGVGDHPNIVNSMDKMVQKLTDAEGKLLSLQQLVSVQSEEVEDGNEG